MLIVKIALCFGVMLPTLSSAQSSRSNERDGLKGPVHSVSVERVRFSNEDKARELSRKKLETVSYGENGRPNERDVYDDYGFFVGRELYQYGQKGLLFQTTLSDDTGKRIELRTYDYNSKGKALSMKTYDANGELTFELNYGYDLKMKLVEEITLKASRVIERKVSKLDLNGASKEVAYYDVAGQLTGKWSFTYNAVGNLSEETLYNSDGSPRKRFVHAYELDPHGNWIVRKTTVSLNSPSEHTYESTVFTYRTIKYYRRTPVRLKHLD